LSEPASAQLRDYSLPEFLQGASVKGGDVPSALAGATERGVLWQAAPGTFLLRVPEVAGFLVEGGSNITVDEVPGAEPSSARRFLGMTPLAALLYQRNHIAFHAAAAVNSQGAILLAGDSGSGKSTLLMALLRRGWSMLADESAVVINDSGKILALPMFPEVRLWEHAAREFGIASQPASQGEGKWQIISSAGQFCTTAQPLRAIYWLGVHNADRIDQRDLEGMERFRALGTLTYNSHIADSLLDRGAYMRQASLIAQTVPMHRLLRPRGKWTADQLADRIVEHYE
jgi:hypothetical protein